MIDSTPDSSCNLAVIDACAHLAAPDDAAPNAHAGHSGQGLTRVEARTEVMQRLPLYHSGPRNGLKPALRKPARQAREGA